MREVEGSPTFRKPRGVGRPQLLEVHIEVENVGNLKVGAIDQNQVSSDEDVSVSRLGRRKHRFQLMRAGLHSPSQTNWQNTAHHKLALQAGRQPVAL